MKKLIIILLLIPCYLSAESDEDLDKNLSNLCKENTNEAFCSVLEKFKHGSVPILNKNSCIIVGTGQKYSLSKNSQATPGDNYALFIRQSFSKPSISFIKIIPENDTEVAEVKELLEATETGKPVSQNSFLLFLQNQFDNQVFDEIFLTERSIKLKNPNGPPGILRQYEERLFLFQIVLGTHRRPSIFIFSTGIKQCFPISRSNGA
ncbi:hypothetical protein [Leptospira neocaledonica]|uniref:Uncharacterized protein n=1 Tax=Leptospira neocaledonica TaxID=2023192 RepID=A0A2M9ZT54_9LEPT|nr:hypothetical protein [Leptospira neocaledonica]PJZ75277.1 hypothetical protein CH365_19690 [Leptospira neocaledonica]